MKEPPTPARGYVKFVTPWTPEKLIKFRKSYHLSQKSLSILLRTTQQRVSEWELGKFTMKRRYSGKMEDLLAILKVISRQVWHKPYGKRRTKFVRLIKEKTGLEIE